jgi:hypothetical protein
MIYFEVRSGLTEKEHQTSVRRAGFGAKITIRNLPNRLRRPNHKTATFSVSLACLESFEDGRLKELREDHAQRPALVLLMLVLWFGLVHPGI